MPAQHEAARGQAPDRTASISLVLYRRVDDLGTWLDVRVESGDPWVPGLSLQIRSEELTVEDHSHKGMAEKLLALLRPGIQMMCRIIVEDCDAPVDL